MDRRVALLRGINVGKAKRIAMADLRALFAELGYADVRTLLNSGNVVFTVTSGGDADHASRIEGAILERLGVASRVTVLLGEEVAEALRENPLAAVADNPSRLLILVLQGPEVVARLRPLLDESWEPEALGLGRRMAYLWCGGGILESRLTEAVNRVVKDAGTARNLATMTKLLALVEGS